jgi:ABC-type lipoprotein release transport system permease subunit
VIRHVIGEGTRLLALGFLLGIPGVYVAGQVLRELLIGVSPFDPHTLVAVAIGFIGLALIACYLAARRVIAIAPERLLRDNS